MDDKTERGFLEFDPDFPDRFAESFYIELFTIMPSVEELFGDPVRQRRMFANMLAMILRYRDKETELRDSLSHLGVKHGEIGLTSMHLKAGRGVFITALNSVVSDMSQEELKHLASAYDEMVLAMTTHSGAKR